MGNFRYKMAQFMLGRNGFDSFCRGLLMAAMILIFADIIVPGKFLQTIALVLMLYAYFRAFSRNTARRYAENAWYVKSIATPFKSYTNRDHKNYRYFKCPSCGQMLRAPKGRGHIRVTCSRCHNTFEKKV